MDEMFIPLRKVDEARRMIFGWVDETPDVSREVMDYPSSKPAFEKWSADQAKASNGVSYGNVRSMHGKVASGIIPEPLVFNDAEKRIEFWAKIVDDVEWAKCAVGAYTGFSPGGGYARRWPDPGNPGLRRYTPVVLEMSLVDKPCIPTATFQLVKAAGGVEERSFQAMAKFEPSNDDVKGRAADLAKAAGHERWKDMVVTARAELIGEAAAAHEAELAKAAQAAADDLEAALTESGAVLGKDAPSGDYGDVKYADPGYQDDKKPRYPVDTAKHIRAAWSYINKEKNQSPYSSAEVSKIKAAIVRAWKDKIDADGPPSAEKMAAESAAITPAALEALGAYFEGRLLTKGVYNLGWIACLLEEVDCLRACLTTEAALEGDNSPAPGQAEVIVEAIAALLVQQAQEETAELLADVRDEPPEAPEIMELAAPVLDLVKAAGGALEKVGKRNSTADAARIQGIHDHAVSLGASCDSEDDMDKLAKLAAESEELARARRVMAAAVPQLRELSKAVVDVRAEMTTALAAKDTDIAGLKEQLEKLAKSAAPGKGVLIAVSKENDGGLSTAPKIDPNGPPPADPRERREWALLRKQARGEIRLLPAPGGGY